MRKACLIPLFVFVQYAAFAQLVHPKNVIRLSPFSVLLGRLTVSYERELSPGISLELDIYSQNMRMNRQVKRGSGRIDYQVAHIGGQLRYYYRNSKIFPSGPYLALFAEYNSVSLNESIESPGSKATGRTSGQVYGLGAVYGRQWLFWKHWTADLYMGAGWYQNNTAPLILHYDDGSERLDLFPKLLFNPLNAGFSLGYCF